MRRFARENSLSLFFLTLFLLTLIGQSFVNDTVFLAFPSEARPAAD